MMILVGDAVDILGSRNLSTGGKVGSGKGTASRLCPRYGDIIEAHGSTRQDPDGDGILILEIGNGIGGNALCSLEIFNLLRRTVIFDRKGDFAQNLAILQYLSLAVCGGSQGYGEFACRRTGGIRDYHFLFIAHLQFFCIEEVSAAMIIAETI